MFNKKTLMTLIIVVSLLSIAVSTASMNSDVKYPIGNGKLKCT